jgi:hypothetical protein
VHGEIIVSLKFNLLKDIVHGQQNQQVDVEIQIGRMQGWLLRAVGSVQKLVWSRLDCLSGEGLFKVYASR